MPHEVKNISVTEVRANGRRIPRMISAVQLLQLVQSGVKVVHKSTGFVFNLEEAQRAFDILSSRHGTTPPPTQETFSRYTQAFLNMTFSNGSLRGDVSIVRSSVGSIIQYTNEIIVTDRQSGLTLRSLTNPINVSTTINIFIDGIQSSSIKVESFVVKVTNNIPQDIGTPSISTFLTAVTPPPEGCPPEFHRDPQTGLCVPNDEPPIEEGRNLFQSAIIGVLALGAIGGSLLDDKPKRRKR